LWEGTKPPNKIHTKVEIYMNVSLKQTASNCTEVKVGEVTLFFSYETCVGFHHASTGTVLSENIWSRTTGKHLNSFGSKDCRIPHADFQKKLEEVMSHNGI
jgi:hypothetical protein